MDRILDFQFPRSGVTQQHALQTRKTDATPRRVQIRDRIRIGVTHAIHVMHRRGILHHPLPAIPVPVHVQHRTAKLRGYRRDLTPTGEEAFVPVAVPRHVRGVERFRRVSPVLLVRARLVNEVVIALGGFVLVLVHAHRLPHFVDPRGVIIGVVLGGHSFAERSFEGVDVSPRSDAGSPGAVRVRGVGGGDFGEEIQVFPSRGRFRPVVRGRGEGVVVRKRVHGV
mmetsp:Transcript_17602/g.21905  ORF Transcript_17602/g.21905 Transcript_17602/m.21905 type:complete len:225 (-) Transcript_17602:256-930(-)